jgi:Mov34/MPN/PAD-1 family.
MKIVKHCHEESTNNIEVAQGALLGLVVDNRLEITNCFPFPKNYDESVDEGNVIPQLKVTERDEEKEKKASLMTSVENGILPLLIFFTIHQ